jgi:TonB-linked SusC/RagA family outer membrane protein
MKKNNQMSCFPKRRWLKILLEMKILVFLILVLSYSTMAKSYSQNQKVSIEIEQATILDVLNEIKEQTGLRFLYKKGMFDNFERVDIEVENEEVKILLDHLLRENGLICDVEEEVITFKEIVQLIPSKEAQEKKTIKGKVTDDKGVALPGVSVVIKGTSIGVATNINGEFAITALSLKLENDDAILVFSFIGMKPKEIQLSNKDFYNVALEVETEGLEEVMVVAYGTTTKNAFTGSAVSISSDELQRNTSALPITALQGQAAGVSISANSGQPGAGYSVNIRGTGSINNNTQPLYIVDGLAMSTGGISSTLTSTDVLSSMHPDDIESMTILKDAAATSLYGSRAANGVVVITTKSGKEGKTKIKIDLRHGISDWAVRDEVETYALGDEYTEYSIMALENYYLERNDYLAHWDRNINEIVPQQEITPEIREKARLYAYRYLNGRAKVVHPDDNLDGEFDYGFIKDFDDLSPEKQAQNMPLLEKYLTHARKDNWAKKMFKKGKTSKVSISAQGGTKTTKFYTSLGYYYQDGMVDKSNYERLNARLNLEHRFNRKLKFRFGQSISHSIQNGVTSGRSFYANPMYALNRMNPTMPIKYNNGEYNISPGFNSKTPNPFINVDLQTRRYWTTRIKSNGTIKYQFSDYLFFESTNGVELLFTKEKKSTDPEHNDGLKFNGKVDLYNQRRFTINSSNILNFRKEIKDHDFGFLVGFELEDYLREKNSVEGKNFANGDKMYIGMQPL